MTDENELSNWIDAYGDELLRIACSYIHDRSSAEDCLQDAFVKAYRKRSQLQNRDRPFPWLIRIVINECKTRNRKNRELLLPILPEKLVQGTEQVVMEKIRLQNVRTAINALPEKYRTPIILHYFHDLQLETVAEILGEKSATIRTRISRARQKLKQLMGEGEPNGTGRTAKGI